MQSESLKYLAQQRVKSVHDVVVPFCMRDQSSSANFNALQVALGKRDAFNVRV